MYGYKKTGNLKIILQFGISMDADLILSHFCIVIWIIFLFILFKHAVYSLQSRTQIRYLPYKYKHVLLLSEYKI